MAGESTEALLATKGLGLVATLSTARLVGVGAAEATIDIALGAGGLGHGGDLLGAPEGGVLWMGLVSLTFLGLT